MADAGDGAQGKNSAMHGPALASLRNLLDMGIELHHLRGFLLLAEERHFTRAAEKLHLSQPSLSRNIRRLEEHMGVRLLARTTRHVDLTPAGNRLYGQLASILPRLEEALRPDRSGEVLRLGFTWGFPASWAHEAMGAFHAETGVRVDPIRKDEALAGLDRGDADVAIVRGRVKANGVRVVVLGEEQRIAAVAAHSPISSRELLRWSELPELPFVVNSVSGTTQLSEWPADNRPVAAATCTNFDEWLEAVAAGRGIGVVPESIAHSHMHPSVVFVPLVGAPPTQLQLVVPRQGAHPLVNTFVAIAQQAAAAHLRRPAPGPDGPGAGRGTGRTP
ncbi:LysR family transcriptional regulator [Streptomyces sp. Ru73]|uniref:LysR family transcriptional regulator n=1 Tax=Streptomyces sp. Ru73 TaxID=2080748 RepID=UPI00215656A5|nr:LysR family transcriptional regulator [Streptomyces sp. Ru73]